ncbi:HAD-IIB family hydrolase [Desulfogranum japonicum]|uniref:HAD-IIB family hydrolase n=1 Tax=Desulfogranum japonicum TaxID=231447 RepID=UPI0004082076|nr:HAD-IIB family hydrolase [Desulfogranum japonicum]
MENNKGLYLQLFSIHGLIRGNMPELGKDADTGGQIKYVLELARALGDHPDVCQVDLVTRYIDDKRLAADYAQIIEPLSENARIVRIQCGGTKYMRKELLWPHLEEFIERTIRFIKSEGRIPDVFHGHYADAGYVAMQLANAFDAPFLFTGHSLGRNKRVKLISDGMDENSINKQYKIDHRIQMEEDIIAQADLIITSTRQEIEEQYGLYNATAKGFCVIPPGIDLEAFYPFYDLELDSDLLSEEVKQTRYTLRKELDRFWANPEKPFILALCRPDKRKNITGLLEAYGTSKELQAIANMAIFAGIRSNINIMEENEKAVLTDMLLQMDRYDLYGNLAIPKKHDFATEVPELYRLCAESHGVFVNPALVEPFGLTLIEASACGLPIVATNYGGPVDIIGNCENGLLIDASQPEKIATAIKNILIDPQKWSQYSNNGINGVRQHYAWQAHCTATLQKIYDLLPDFIQPSQEKDAMKDSRSSKKSYGARLTNVNHLLITDIDNTLVGDAKSMRQLFNILDDNQGHLAWGVATGRSLELTIEAMTEFDIPVPDILICSVGTEIYYGPDIRHDKGWQKHISVHWKPERIKEVLDDLGFLVFQEAEGQRSHKISYYLEDKNTRLDRVYQALQEHKLRCKVIYSHGQFLDILPQNASKGKAIDYVSYKFDFSPRHVLVAGDSGNDEDMIAGKSRGLVVGNHSEELKHLQGQPDIHFSNDEYAAGIIDGLRHYGFI